MTDYSPVPTVERHVQARNWSIFGGALLVLVLLGAAILAAFSPTWAVPVTLGSVVAAGIFFNPSIGIPVVFFLGLIGELQHFGEGGASLVKLAVLLMGVGALGRTAGGRLSLRRTALLGPLALFMIVYCLGVYRALEFKDVLSGPATTLGYVILFALTLNLVSTRRHVEWIALAVAAGVLLVSLVSITQWFGLVTPLSALRGLGGPAGGVEAAPGVRRSLGLAYDPNAAAYPLILGIPFLLAAGTVAKTSLRRAAHFIVVGLAAAGLLTTGSRSGVLGAAVATVALFFFVRGRRRTKVVAVVALCLYLVVATGPFVSVRNRFSIAWDDFEKYRAVQYEIGYHLLSEHPLAGVDRQVFRSEMQHRTGVPLEPHSNLLGIAVYSGLAGICTVLFFLIRYVGFLWRGLKGAGRSELRAYAIGGVGSVIGLNVQGLLIGNMGWSLFWAMLALPVCCILVQREAEFGPVRTPPISSVPHAR